MVDRRQLLKLSALGTASFAVPQAYSASNITMAYNTGNPIGSTSPKDLSDNAANLDHFVNGENSFYPDRRSVKRKSWKGMEGEFNADQTRRVSDFDFSQSSRETRFVEFMDASGFEPPVPYAQGLNLVRITQTVSYLGNEYRVKSEFLPLTTTAWEADEPKLKLIGDDSLRQEMASADGASLSGWKRGPVVTLGARVHRMLNASAICVWEFADLISHRPDISDPETWDWKPAFDAAYAYAAANYPQHNLRYSKSVEVPGMKYLVSGTIGPTKVGIQTIGEGPLTSVITAMPGFVGDWVFLAQHDGSNGNMGGSGAKELGIDCAGVAVGGANWVDAYDGVKIDNLRVSRVHVDKVGFRMGPRADGLAGRTVSQTIKISLLFVYKDGGGSTVPPVQLIKVQEAQIIGGKAWAGGYDGATRGNTCAWYIEDCRSIDMLGCSAVGAQNFGVEVRASTKSTDGIRLRGMLYENCNGTLRTSSSDAANFPIKALVHDLPRVEFPSSGGFDLGGLYGGFIDAGPTVGTLQADTDQCRVVAQRIANWTDLAVSSKRNLVDSYPNAVDNFKGTNKPIRVIQASTPRMTLGRTDTADFCFWEWSSSVSAENGWRTGFNRAGVDKPVLRGDDTRSFVGPGVDATYSSGHPSWRWSTVYASTGTINTSDAREKTPVRGLTDAEIAAAKVLGKAIGLYKWLAAVQDKGADARQHVGMTVQRAIEVMEEHGLNPFDYGFICHDTWEATEAMHDEEGNCVEPARAAGDRFSFRMDELLAFIATGFEARLSALEAL
ncbi:tail fiber domain-containing protein [Pseudomonas vancouverensis]|uniref:tail fiber domain-containing protein n=1 Tax=Pseudomonas vancouverensis TaxID=95300 RepID=UPI003CFE815D